MKRTQIYITDEQDRRIAGLAADLGVSKADVVRRMLDQGLELGDSEEEARAVILATAGLLSDYPDWEEWQRAVRGRPAGERLGSLGL